MSRRTSKRRFRRKIIAGIVAILRDEPRLDDPEFARRNSESTHIPSRLAYSAAHMYWEQVHMITMMSRFYDAAKARVRAEL